jgi:CDP-diacylglycerol--glycerol-3-phosphate 3-phosphatidyltransferase
MVLTPFENQTALTSLQKRWWIFCAACVIFLTGGGLALARVWHWIYARGWIVLTVAVLAYQVWLLRTSLVENHRIGESRLLSGLGWGNIITLTRGVLFAGLTGFLLIPEPPGGLAWVPAALYTVGALIDFLDGYIARITNQVTQLGEKLDMSMDGWGMLVASILAVRYGQVPVWYLLVGAARYLFLAGLWIREQLHWPVAELPSNENRRPFAGLQMGFAFVMLWPIFRPPGTFHAAAFFAIPFLFNFFWDWLVVSRTVPANGLSGGLGRLLRSIGQFAVRWLPLGLRFAAVVLMAQPLLGWWLDYPSQVSGLQRLGAAFPLAVGAFLAILETAVVSSLLLGAAGRVAAIAGMVALGIHQFYQPLTGLQLLLAWVLGALLYLGTGAFSIWKPEDGVIYRRAGEKNR